MPPESYKSMSAYSGTLYMIDNNGNMVEVAKLNNISLMHISEISLEYNKYLKRVKNRNKLYNKLKKLGR